MKRILYKTKKIVGDYTNRACFQCELGVLPFESQYKILREHLRLCGLGFGVPHDFFDLGEDLLDKWATVLNDASVFKGTVEDIKTMLRDEFKAEPSPAKNRVRIRVANLVERNNISFIDLFAGIGGFHQAMHSVGAHCVFASEWDKSARESYEANYRGIAPNLFADNCRYFNSDINDARPEDIPDFDVCCGGFPCQAFSIAGLKRGFDDTRGTLFFNIANIVRYKKEHGHAPKVLFLENVKGLKMHDKGRTLEVILGTLDELGYGYSVEVLNAKYFGVPQNRERLFIIAWDRDRLPNASFRFPYGIDEEGNTIYDKSQLSERAMRTCLSDIFEPRETMDSKFTISDRMWIGHQERKKRNRANGKGFGYSLFKPDASYCSTISARYWKDGSEILIDQSEFGMNPRKLTPVEAGRLQGYNIEGKGWAHPDSTLKTHEQVPYTIVVSNKEAYHQFGNSVAVPVIKRLAQEIVKQLILL